MGKILMAFLIVSGALFSSISVAAAESIAPLSVHIEAPTIATLNEKMSGGADVVCNAAPDHVGIAACSNSISLSGSIRSSEAGTGTVAIMVGNVIGNAGNTLDLSALHISCAESGSAGKHGEATFANVSPMTAAGAVCASWAGANVFTYDVQLSFEIDSAKAATDSYRLVKGSNFLAVVTAT